MSTLSSIVCLHCYFNTELDQYRMFFLLFFQIEHTPVKKKKSVTSLSNEKVNTHKTIIYGCSLSKYEENWNNFEETMVRSKVKE